eukprot:723429-Alexandrium_andersonii.AAC.2
MQHSARTSTLSHQRVAHCAYQGTAHAVTVSTAQSLRRNTDQGTIGISFVQASRMSCIIAGSGTQAYTCMHTAPPLRPRHR